MFTGIIQGQAIIKNKTSNFSEITFETDLNLSDCKTGFSINCDGNRSSFRSNFNT